jgi:hypothetical protein
LLKPFVSLVKRRQGEKPKETEGRREEAAKVSALVLANAYIFQEQLSLSDKRVTPLRKLEMKSDLVDVTARHWRWIWQEVNYIQIFQLGDRVLSELPISGHTTTAVKALLVEAKNICSEQAALRHDLMGRIYHWLLHHAKYLGTYYTSTSSATLLLKLAMSSEWKRDFGEPADLASFKVADLACGTGTLLMAAAQALSDVFIPARAADDRSLDTVDLSTLHKTLIENTLLRWHQQLTENFGARKLVSRCYEIIGMGKTCTTIRELREKVAHHYGKEPMQLTMYLPKPAAPLKDEAAS